MHSRRIWPSILAGFLAVIVATLVSIKLFPMDPAQTSVMITNPEGTSGGSGTIIQTSLTQSTILTNKHVCDLIKNSKGGMVVSRVGSYYISDYLEAQSHDLCLIRVAADLKNSAKISDSPPLFLDEAKAIGHPMLLPTIVSRGNFSDKMVVSVLMGRRPCTALEQSQPPTALFCAIVGFMPVIKSFETIVVSTTIQPGSSGSGIFDINNKISAVVFAGGNEFGYAFAVPQEYIYNFLHKEMFKLKFVSPESEVSINSSSASIGKEELNKVYKACNAPDLKSFCSKTFKNVIYNQLVYGE